MVKLQCSRFCRDQFQKYVFAATITSHIYNNYVYTTLNMLLLHVFYNESSTASISSGHNRQ